MGISFVFSAAFVNAAAVLPHSSIRPVDSGVSMARYLALTTPSGAISVSVT